MKNKDYKLLGIDLATSGDYTSFGDTIVQNKTKCLNCGRKLNGELAREEFGLEFNDVVSRTIENLKVIRRKMFEKLEVRDE